MLICVLKYDLLMVLYREIGGGGGDFVVFFHVFHSITGSIDCKKYAIFCSEKTCNIFLKSLRGGLGCFRRGTSVRFLVVLDSIPAGTINKI